MKALDQIIIHVGLQKTGSSFLQSALEFLEEEKLLLEEKVIDPI